MRKIFLFLFTIGLVLFSSTTTTNAAGDYCRSIGGECRTACLSNEVRRGSFDCETEKMETERFCCFPKGQNVPKKSCGEPCVGAAECPSSCPACQEQLQGQGKVCRVAGPVYSPTCDICGCTPPGVKIDCQNCNTECQGCINAGNSWTALGCITTSSPQEFISWLLGAAIGIAGGIAFLLMLWGGFQVITSTGDPEKLNKGKEILTSAIIGLVVIIFSVFLLKLIGVDILQLPGFGK